MNSKIFLLILGIFSFSILSTGCREPNGRADLNDGNATKEAMSSNEVGGGESIETSEAEAILKSSVESPEISFNDVYFNLSDSSSSSTKAQNKIAFDKCLINFNSSSALGLMVDQAQSTFSSSPHYIETCSSGDFFVYAAPVNLDHFHLMYEHNHCFGPGLNVGIDSNGSCISQKEAKFWPRFATNMNNNTGIKFYAKTRQNVRNNFDLEGIKVVSGSIEVWVYRTDVKKWWVWRDLKVGSWSWTKNNTNLSDIYIYDNGQNGTYEIDNLEVTNLR